MVGGGSWWLVVGGGGGCWEAGGDHRSQFLRTDFGLDLGVQSSNNAARTPEATLVWGNMSN